MRNRLQAAAGVALLTLAAASGASPGGEAGEARALQSVRITTDRTVDCTSLEGIVKGIIKPGMTDRQKAKACWDFYRLRTIHLGTGRPFPEQSNPIATLQHHGMGYCGPVAYRLTPIMRAAGLPAAVASAIGHAITEVFYDGAWHMYDADMHEYYIKADGQVASVHEIFTVPGLKARPAHKSYPWFNGHDWLGGITKLYTGNKKPRPTDARTVDRCRKNPKWKWHYRLDLRPGMEMAWSWFPDADVGYARINYIGKSDPPRKDRPRWSTAVRGGFRTGPIPTLAGYCANGRLVCSFGQAWQAFRFLAADVRNLAVKDGRLQQTRPDAPGSFELRLECPYYFADGWVAGPLPREGLKIEFSKDGKAWKGVWPEGGMHDGKRLRLFDQLNCQMRGRLRFTLAAGSGLCLKGLEVVGVFHHNFTALPALLRGTNAVTIHCADPSALARHPLDVTYVYDQVDDQRRVMRRAWSFRATPGKTTRKVDAGKRHWPLMRELRLRCLLSPDEPAAQVKPPREVKGFADWGSYPYSKAMEGVNYHQDFERGDKDGWIGKLVTSPTYKGSDFALDNTLTNKDGSRQLKVYRNIGGLTRNTRIRFAAFVKGVKSIRLMTQDRTDGKPTSDGKAGTDKRAWYETHFTDLKQGQWNVLECAYDQMKCPRYPDRPFSKDGRFSGWYITASAADGVANKDAVFLIDDFLCWDEGIMKADPLAAGPGEAP